MATLCTKWAAVAHNWLGKRGKDVGTTNFVLKSIDHLFEIEAAVRRRKYLSGGVHLQEFRLREKRLKAD